MTLKTKTVSEELGVNPTTVQRWVKYFNIPCERNEHGHYMFTETDFLLLKNIKEQLQHGLPMSQVNIEIQPKNQQTATSVAPRALSNNEMCKKYEEILTRVDHIEDQLEEKADEIVTIQILQHRNEIDDLLQKITKLEEKVQDLHDRLQEQAETAREEKQPKTMKKRWLASISSLF